MSITDACPATTLAKLFNLHERRVRQLGQEGIIPRPQHGTYDLVGAVQGYVKYLQERAEGRGVEPSALHEERMRLLTAQAEHKELEVAALHRSLLPFDEVVAAWQQVVAAFRAKCLALPSKLAPRLAVIHERRKVQDALTVEIREALEELSRLELAGEARGQERPPSREPTAGANGKSMGRSKPAAEPRGQRRTRTVPVH